MSRVEEFQQRVGVATGTTEQRKLPGKTETANIDSLVEKVLAAGGRRVPTAGQRGDVLLVYPDQLPAVEAALANVEQSRNLPNFKVMLTLRSSCGCVGQGILGTGQPLTWDVDPVNETVQAIFSRIDVVTLHVVEVVEMDGDDWREFEDGSAEASLVANVANGHSLEAALDGVPASTCAPSPGM